MQNQNEKLYMQAKEAYYNGNPIMSDAEFDALEVQLKREGSNVVLNVGAWDRRAKIQHPTPMLSLAKIQADKQTGEAPLEEYNKWIDETVQKIKQSDLYKTTPETQREIYVEFSQKLDGNAINVVYENGTVKHALSRGDGAYGRDYLPKLIKYGQFPLTINWNTDKIVEVRCEAVIDKDLFEKKYSQEFANERNYVAGILNSDDSTPEQLSEIDLVPVEVRASDGNGTFHNLYIDVVAAFGFKNANKLKRSVVSTKHKVQTFLTNFAYYESFKEKGKYRVDGMVVKFDEKWRQILGENEHDPNWGLAVKFKPDDCITEVIGFSFEIGKTGEFTPVALLKPVDLDGSTVTKASAYNYNFILNNNLNVGSLVTLVKSGDIIPQIVNVINDMEEPYDVSNMRCPYCHEPLIVENDTHIKCVNPECEGIALKKFINAMDALDVFGCGDAMCEEIFFNITQSPFVLLEAPKDWLEKTFVNHGLTTKNHGKFIDELKKIESVTLETVIAMMSFEGMSNGGKTIKEVAHKIAGNPYSFKGLEKKVVEGFEEGEKKRRTIDNIVYVLRDSGIDVIYPEPRPTEDSSQQIVKITMTGSPKEYGYTTKAVFVKHLTEDLGWKVEEVDVKKCDILFTDSPDSNTGKMKTARDLGKEIKTYGEF